MDREHLESWFKELKNAWESGNPDEALSLFKHTKTYYEEPFSPPATNYEDVVKLWNEIRDQSEINVDYQILAVEKNVAVARWVASFFNKGERHSYDGVCDVEFDENGNCVHYRQWWMRVEMP